MSNTIPGPLPADIDLVLAEANPPTDPATPSKHLAVRCDRMRASRDRWVRHYRDLRAVAVRLHFVAERRRRDLIAARALACRAGQKGSP